MGFMYSLGGNADAVTDDTVFRFFPDVATWVGVMVEDRILAAAVA